MGCANKGLAAAVMAWLVNFVGAARTQATGTLASVDGFVQVLRGRCLEVVGLMRERFAKVLSLPARVKESTLKACIQASLKAHDALIGAGTWVLSYAPASVKTAMETAYVTAVANVSVLRDATARTMSAAVANATYAKTKVMDYVQAKADAFTQRFAGLTALAKPRYAALVSQVSAVAEMAKAKSLATLEATKVVAITTVAQAWDRVPGSVRARVTIITTSAAARAAALGERASSAWKYTSEDAKARTTAKAAAGGVATGGACGFVAGGTVGAVIGLIPALFTFGLSIPLGAVMGSGIGLGCGAAAGGAAGFASGAAYANRTEMTRSASMYKDYVKDQASHIQGKASVSMSEVARRLRRSGTGGTA